jgi:hypothetical protein
LKEAVSGQLSAFGFLNVATGPYSLKASAPEVVWLTADR